MNTLIKYCNTCLLANKEKRICVLNRTPINPDIDYCSKHQTEIKYCGICRQPLIGASYLEEKDGKVVEYCGNCRSLLNSCRLCSYIQVCAFETDPNPLPKVVVRTVQQNGMQMQMQVRNEERVKALCPSCHCWNEEVGCLKEFNIGCDKNNVTMP